MASPLPRTLDVARSLASTLAQQGRGIATRPAGRQPAEPLELYRLRTRRHNVLKAIALVTLAQCVAWLFAV